MRLPEKVFASLDEFAELCRTHESLWRHGKEQGLLVTGLCEGARESFAAAFYAARGEGQGPALLILPQERCGLPGVFCRMSPFRLFQYLGIQTLHSQFYGFNPVSLQEPEDFRRNTIRPG